MTADAGVAGAYELDLDTALQPAGNGRYLGTLTDRWSVGVGINGGYLAAFCLQGVLLESELPDPLSMTMHYLSRPLPGPAEVRVEAMRAGRGHATYRFDLLQHERGSEPESRVDVRATGLVLTGRHREPGPLDFGPSRPDVPGPDRCSAIRRWSAGDEHIAIWGRLDQRVAKADDVFFLRTEAGPARAGGWTRLADGRPADRLVAPLFLDAWPPAIFSRTMRPDGAGAPTLELTVHWRRPIGPGWLLARMETEMLAGGYIDEKGELWDENGVLVAESRQLARYTGA